MVHPESIIKAVSWVILLPFYIYALIKWHQFRSHFLIRNRFPKISYILFYIIFVAQTASTIEGWLHDENMTNHVTHSHLTYFILSLTFTISGLILYRINLIYLRWKINHSLATHNNDHNKEQTKNEPVHESKSVYHSTLSLLTLCFIFIGSLVLYAAQVIAVLITYDRNHVSYVVIAVFSLLFMLIAASIYNIEHRKVQEGIGCIKECYAILISLVPSLVIEVILIVLPYSAHDTTRFWECSTFFILNYQAVVTLYIPLYLLLEAEGSLSFRAHQNGLNIQIFRRRKHSRNKDQNIAIKMSPSDFNNTVNKTTDFVKQLESNSSTPRQLQILPTNSSDSQTIIVHESLFAFLYQNEVNHRIFSEYLRYCFAIENLLFVERVSVFYQIVKEMKEKSNINVQSTSLLRGPSGSEMSETEIASDDELPGANSFHSSEFGTIVEEAVIRRFEFRYLTDIYKHYQQMIHCTVKDKEAYDVEQYKHVLLDICQEIYDEFVSCFAATQINLAHETQERLDVLLGGARGESDGNGFFRTYDDFLRLFRDSLIETYGLMISAYLFQFKRYVRDRFTDVQFQ